MLEANTFRFMMLILAVMVLAAVVTGFFTIPMVELTPTDKMAYQRVMNVDMGTNNSLTGYQAFHYWIEGKSRGNVQHY